MVVRFTDFFLPPEAMARVRGVVCNYDLHCVQQPHPNALHLAAWSGLGPNSPSHHCPTRPPSVSVCEEPLPHKLKS